MRKLMLTCFILSSMVFTSVLITSKVEAFAAGVTFLLLLGLIPTGIALTTYLLFYTQFSYVATMYLFWIWIVDADTPNGKSRMNNWVQSWALFKYTTNYFPINVVTDTELILDPQKNYLACCFPHGLMPTGLIMTFLTNAYNVKKRFSQHEIYATALKGLFYIPLYRDFLLSLGICNANATTIEKIVTHPTGGKILGIIIGGAAEMFYFGSGVNKVVLKNRKGFVKIALKTGTPLIPVFSFGENRIYKQKTFREGSLPHRLQQWSKVIIGYPLIICCGRGLFQETFGMIPFKTPINIVVGEPITVEKIENPTQADIDALHKRFVSKLVALFEKHKYTYEPDPEKSQLIIC